MGQSGTVIERDPRLLGRSLALFTNFFFIILAYYQVKAASRSLLIEFGGTEALPYAWVYSAIALTLLIGSYHFIVERFTRVKVVLASLLIFAGLLLFFRLFATPDSMLTALSFYIFVDIFSVVLVEQFWSLTDSVSSSEQGTRSFWFVGSGGLAGGILSGILATLLLTEVGLHTQDLLYSCAALLLVVFALNVAMWRAGMYAEVQDGRGLRHPKGDWRVLFRDRYLILIAAVLCLSQLAEPIVEYQFLRAVAAQYTDVDLRTAFIGEFFSLMGLVSIGVNLALTPLIHRLFGAIGGMVVQPLVLACCTMAFYLHSTLLSAAIMKIGDRGLSYSINRASKELLYVPVDPLLTYQAKAWIDMFGYRLFKVLGSGLILAVTNWFPGSAAAAELSWVTAMICVLWIISIVYLAQAYRAVLVSS